MAASKVRGTELTRRGKLQSPFLSLAPAAIFVLATLPATARAQQITFELDPAKTHVEFTLDAFLHTVHGTFQAKPGKIEVDPATGRCSGRVVVDARSADTANDGRDSKMHKDVLESQQYPEIVFTPARIQGQIAPQGASQLQLQGTITLHGRDQEISTPIEVQITGNEWTGDTTFPVPYVKWGLKNPSNLFLRVKDTVNLTVHAAGALMIAGSQP
jgi:polyisoprenoid-binding protein YceI